MILIVLKVQIRPDRRDVWLERIAKYAAAVREEPGNVCFDCYEAIDAPNEFSIIEGFADKASGDRHVTTDGVPGAAQERRRHAVGLAGGRLVPLQRRDRAVDLALDLFLRRSGIVRVLLLGLVGSQRDGTRQQQCK